MQGMFASEIDRANLPLARISWNMPSCPSLKTTMLEITLHAISWLRYSHECSISHPADHYVYSLHEFKLLSKIFTALLTNSVVVRFN